MLTADTTASQRADSKALWRVVRTEPHWAAPTDNLKAANLVHWKVAHLVVQTAARKDSQKADNLAAQKELHWVASKELPRAGKTDSHLADLTECNLAGC